MDVYDCMRDTPNRQHRSGKGYQAKRPDPVRQRTQGMTEEARCKRGPGIKGQTKGPIRDQNAVSTEHSTCATSMK